MVSEAVKLEREKRKTLRQSQITAILGDPLTLAICGTAIGLYAAERIPWSDDEGRNTRMKVAVETAVLYAALSRVGAKGWPAALGALGGGLLVGGDGAGTAWSPLQAGGATALGAGVGTIVPGVGTLVGAGVGLGVDTIYQMIT